MRALLPLVLALGACASVVPDWNTRPIGLHQKHKPEFRVRTVPSFTGVAGEVVIYARVNHAPEWKGAELEIGWSTAKIVLAPKSDLSWTFRGRFPVGTHRFNLRVLLEGKTKIEGHTSVRLRAKGEKGVLWR